MVKIRRGNYKLNTKELESFGNFIQNKSGTKGDITIVIGSERDSSDLNLRFRGKNYPTDVLSFPNNEKIDNRLYLGDIFICYEVAKKQAEESGFEIAKEIKILIVHGILHLAGYDHEIDNGEMFEKQKELLKLQEI